MGPNINVPLVEWNRCSTERIEFSFGINPLPVTEAIFGGDGSDARLPEPSFRRERSASVFRRRPFVHAAVPADLSGLPHLFRRKSATSTQTSAVFLSAEETYRCVEWHSEIPPRGLVGDGLLSDNADALALAAGHASLTFERRVTRVPIQRVSRAVSGCPLNVSTTNARPLCHQGMSQVATNMGRPGLKIRVLAGSSRV